MMKKQPFLFRMLLFNIVVVLMAAIIPQAVIFSFVMPAYNQELEALSVQKVKQIRSSLDQNIVRDMVQGVTRSLTGRNPVLEDTSLDVRNNSKNVLDVLENLETIRNNMAFGFSVDYYNRTQNVLFYSGQRCIPGESECAYDFRKPWIDRFLAMDIQLEWTAPSISSQQDTGPVISYLRSVPLYADKSKRYGMIAVSVPVSAINKELMNLLPSKDGTLLIVDDQNRILAHNQQSNKIWSIGAELHAKWRPQTIIVGQEGLFKVEEQSETTVVSYIKSAYNGWRYVVLTSKSLLYQRADNLRTLLYGFGAMLTSAALLLTLWFTKHANKPIVATISDLNERLLVNRPVILHNQIMGLLHGEAPPPLYKAPQTGGGLNLPHPYCICFSIRIQPSTGQDFDNYINEVYRFIEWITSQDNNAGGLVFAVKDRGSQIHGLINFEKELDLNNSMSWVEERLRLTLGTGQIGYGTKRKAVGEMIHQSFEEALEALSYHFLYPELPSILYTQLHIADRVGIGFPSKLLDELEAAIRGEDKTKASSVVSRVVQDLKTKRYTLSYIRNTCLDLVITLHKTVKSYGISSSVLFGYDIRDMVQSLQDIQDYESWMDTLLNRTFQELEKLRKQSVMNLDIKVKQIVEELLYSNVSLDLVAEKIGVNPNYLSRTFKAATGTNYIEYVTERKMQEAVILLKLGNFTVLEIANRLGYQSPNHFIRIFKGRFGQTPKQYQKFLFEQRD
jgi:AraC-like DNA-binding protein